MTQAPLRDNKQLLVEQHDSPLRYRVQSQEHPEIWYLVDLAANNQIGRCTCPNFEFRIQPRLKLTIEKSDSLRCKHLIRVRELFANALIEEITKQEPKNLKKNE